jgi:hypothetical protein
MTIPPALPKMKRKILTPIFPPKCQSNYLLSYPRNIPSIFRRRCLNAIWPETIGNSDRVQHPGSLLTWQTSQSVYILRGFFLRVCGSTYQECLPTSLHIPWEFWCTYLRIMNCRHSQHTLMEVLLKFMLILFVVYMPMLFTSKSSV